MQRDRTRYPFNCEHCGSAFTKAKSQIREHNFCSHSCYTSSEYHAQRTALKNYKPKAEFNCSGCGVLCARNPSQVEGRKTLFCSKTCRAEWQLAQAPIQTNGGGYLFKFVGKGFPGADKAGKILIHRLVMQKHLNRVLYASENVHHINGDRQDNRLENLELWNTSQPAGQRVEDKLAWAKEILKLYGEE